MDIDAKTALVIHYSTAKVHMLSALLKPFSLNVVHATTADEAKRLFRSLRPELTIIGLIQDWIPLLDVLRSGCNESVAVSPLDPLRTFIVHFEPRLMNVFIDRRYSFSNPTSATGC